MAKFLKQFEIIDIHNHIFPEKIAFKAACSIRDYYKLPMEGDGTSKTLKEQGSPLNIKKIVISSAATKAENVRSANDFIYKRVQEDPIFVGLGSVHAGYDGKEEEIERIISLGLLGLKFHTDFQGFPIDDERLLGVYRLAEKHKLPILFHVGDEKSDLSSARRLRNVMEKFPDLIVIGAHMGGYMRKNEAEELLVGTHAYFDSSEWHNIMSKEEMCEMSRKHGIDKIIYGCDYPLNSPYTSAKALFDCPFTDEEKEKIYSKNIKKVFNFDFK